MMPSEDKKPKGMLNFVPPSEEKSVEMDDDTWNNMMRAIFGEVFDRYIKELKEVNERLDRIEKKLG